MEAARYATVGGAAKMLGINRTTLVQAVRRGAVAVAVLADGERLVAVADVQRWAADPAMHQRGRKKKPTIADS